MSKRILHEITGSPNSVKARIALGYKGLEYERDSLHLDNYPGDRHEIVKISRQPRLPMLEDGDVKIFDSHAIMRYLEANYPETPPLFVEDWAAHAEIEQWELFARTQIGEAIGIIFGEAFKPEGDPKEIGRARKILAERTGVLEDKLSTGDFLVGDHLTAGDVCVAANLYLSDLTEEQTKDNPIAAFFKKNLPLGEDRPKTIAFTRRVMAYDPVKGSA